MLAQVEREELDLAVMVYADHSVPPRMTMRPLLDLPFILIAPKALGCRSWRDAARALPLLRYDASSASGRDVDGFLARAEVEISDSLWINYLDTMISLVARGLGVAFVPRSPLGPARRHIDIFPLGRDTFYRRVGILRRSGPPNGGALAEAFITILLAEAAEEPFAMLPADPALFHAAGRFETGVGSSG